MVCDEFDMSLQNELARSTVATSHVGNQPGKHHTAVRCGFGCDYDRAWVDMPSNTSATRPSAPTRNGSSIRALTRVRIGFNAFWDVALISTFEMALRANGVDPEFVLLSDWHDSAIDAFRNEMIDVALHNYHTVLYEQQLPAAKRVGVEWVCPLFIFRGHHIFISHTHLARIQRDPRAAPVLQRSAGAVNLPEGLYPSDFPEHTNVLSAFLENARVGFERGTDQEIAFRKAYDFAGLEFPSDSHINRGPEGLALWRGAPSESAPSSELCHAFREGLLDLYCGGWQQLYQLRGEGYSILLGPEALAIDSFNGLITTERFRHAELLKAIREAWFCGVTLFTEWTKALRRPDGSGAARARVAIESVLLSIEHNSQSREEERILVDAGDEFPVTGIGLTLPSSIARADLPSSDPQTSRNLTAICDELKQIAADSESLDPVARLVNEFISKASLSPKQVAGIAGVSDETVYRWKKAKGRPSEEHIAKMKQYALTSGARSGLHDEIREAFKAERRWRDERVAEWAQLLCRYDQFSEAQVESGFVAWQKSDDFGLWTRSQAEYARAQFLRSTEASATGR